MNLTLAIVLFGLAVDAQQYRAFWVDAFHPGFKSPAEIDQLVDDLRQAGANAVFVQMRRRGDVYFTRSLEPPAADPAYSPGFDALEYLLRRARGRGIEVHAWFVVGPAWRDDFGPPPDPRHVFNLHGPSAHGDAMWLTMNDRGEVAMRTSPAAAASYALDLGHPDAARYLADVLTDPLRHYDLDGLHLDYIRYPEYAGDWGRNPKAVERFQRLHNRTGAPDAADPRWSEFRRAQVTALVRQVYLRAHALRPRVKVSAALITWGDGPADTAAFARSHAYNRVFQDWRGWLEEGILDLGLPMNYFRELSNAAYLNHWLEFEKDHQYGRAIVPGLGVYLNSVQDALAQVERAGAASKAGHRVPGVNFYSYAATNNASRPNADFFRAIAAAGDAGAPPWMPWLAQPARGRVYGWLTVAPGAAWLSDGAEILIESDSSGRVARTVTDATGFFGAVELTPDRYRVRVERGGREVFRTAAQELKAGESLLFHLFLKDADFSGALPAVRDSMRTPERLVLFGVNLAGDPDPGDVQVLVNGAASPVLSALPHRLEIALPEARYCTIVVRRAGMESAPYQEAPATVDRPSAPGRTR